jgi:hypothetical protein
MENLNQPQKTAATSELIERFICEWMMPLERLAQTIFSHPKFQEAVATNTTRAFLRDKNREILEDCFKKAKVRVHVPQSKYIEYPILHALFKPLFDELIAKGTTFLWGGINYWDTVANDFYSEQFVNPDKDPEDSQIFKRGMKWAMKEGSEKTLIPMTTFIFEKCTPPKQAAVFAKNEALSHQEDLNKREFYDLVGAVSVPTLANKQKVREDLARDDTSSLDRHFKSSRQNVSVKYHSSGGVSESKNDRKLFSNLFELFELITPAEGWKRLYYISARLKPEAKVAGLLLTAEGEVDQTLINFVQFFLGRISSFIEYVISSYEVIRQAIRSAIAAIMGRNMSHNIGSHVLARISTAQTVGEALFSRKFLNDTQAFIESPQKNAAEGEELGALSFVEEEQIRVDEVKTAIEVSTKLTAQLNAFLRMRMDFVADIATALKPPSPMTMSFLGEMLFPFASQQLLWTNLCGSQNLTHQDIGFRVIRNGATVDIEARLQGYPESIDSELAAIAVGVPNGALGCQAFYSIVENFVRNTVKHSKESGRRQLKITFRFNSEGVASEHGDLIKLTISDNWQACKSVRRLTGRNLTADLSNILRQPLIRENGSLLSSNRGLKEMKAAAAYLRGLPPEAIEDNQLSPRLLEPVEDEEGNLGYELLLLKPKELFVMDCALPLTKPRETGTPTQQYPYRNLLRRQGVEIASSIKETIDKSSSYSILLVNSANDKDVESLTSNTDLPIRVLIHRNDTVEAVYGSYREKRNTPDIQKLYARLITSLKAGKGTSAITDARELWMRMMCHENKTELWIDEDITYTKWNISGISKLVEKEAQPAPDSQIMLYSRHGFSNRQHNVAFYEPYSKGVDPISFVLENPPESYEARRSLAYQLIEAGALSIIILDERVQETANTVKRSFSHDLNSGEQKDMIEWLELMRVYVPPKADLDLESESLTREQIESWLEETRVKCSIGCRLPPLIVIHQGILDSIGLSDANKAQTWIDRVKRGIRGPKISDVIITSGRGVPDNISPNARFIPLSTLVLYAVERKSKFHLVKALLAARRTRAGGKR